LASLHLLNGCIVVPLRLQVKLYYYPAMSKIFVSDLLDGTGKIEFEATVVLPA